VRNLNETVENAIIAIEPGLAPSIDNLFLCGDHFKKLRSREKKGFNQRRYSSYTAENINKGIETGEISLCLAKNKHFVNRPHLQNLLKHLSRNPIIDTTPSQRQFDPLECESLVVRRLNKMAGNFCHRGDNYGGYNHPSTYQQFEGGYPEGHNQSTAYGPGYQDNG